MEFQFLNKANTEQIREVPINTPEIATEHPAPASGDGAGAKPTSCAELATANRTTTSTKASTMLNSAISMIFLIIVKSNFSREIEKSVG